MAINVGVELRALFLPPIKTFIRDTFDCPLTTNTMDPGTTPTNRMTFSVLSSSAPVLAPRVGRLTIPGRKTLSTPHYISLTSKGTVPHITHDLVQKETAINSLYVGLEDCTFKTTKILRSYDLGFQLTLDPPSWAQISP